MNGITEEADPTIYSGKVIRPLRSVDPTQTEYQGMIEIVDEGKNISIMFWNLPHLQMSMSKILKCGVAFVLKKWTKEKWFIFLPMLGFYFFYFLDMRSAWIYVNKWLICKLLTEL